MEEVHPIIYWFGFVTAFAGLVGYSSKPLYEFDRHEKYVEAIATFYLITALSFLLHAIYRLFYRKLAYVEIGVVVMLLAASLYLMVYTGIEKFDIKRFKDALLYGAITWLMGQQLQVVKEYFLYAVPVLSAFTIPVFLVSVYLFYSIRNKTVYFTFEEHDKIISSSFFVIYLAGLSTLFVDIPNVHFTFKIVASGVLLYILYKLGNIARLFV